MLTVSEMRKRFSAIDWENSDVDRWDAYEAAWQYWCEHAPDEAIEQAYLDYSPFEILEDWEVPF